ncbi:hypothetical protein LZ30DRAFT_709162 [Colletotrichum cereale]|nr:hypothetical protein LZ30DRAFT_709162 [Colletotrichum cereale]
MSNVCFSCSNTNSSISGLRHTSCVDRMDMTVWRYTYTATGTSRSRWYPIPTVNSIPALPQWPEPTVSSSTRPQR